MPCTSTAAEANAAAAGSPGAEASRAVERMSCSRISSCIERSTGCAVCGADATGPLSRVEGAQCVGKGGAAAAPRVCAGLCSKVCFPLPVSKCAVNFKIF